MIKKSSSMVDGYKCLDSAAVTRYSINVLVLVLVSISIFHVPCRLIAMPA